MRDTFVTAVSNGCHSGSLNSTPSFGDKCECFDSNQSKPVLAAKSVESALWRPLFTDSKCFKSWKASRIRASSAKVGIKTRIGNKSGQIPVFR